MNKLDSLDIGEQEDFFAKNEIDLSCRACRGEGKVQIPPPRSKVEPFVATAADVAADDSLVEGRNYFRVVGVRSLEGLSYDDKGEAEAALADEDNWEGDTESCEECSGASGYHEIMWNRIWNTEYEASHAAVDLPHVVGSAVAFEYDGSVWFGLAGAGQDLTPDLAALWMEVFPDCSWLPEQFCKPDRLEFFAQEMSAERFAKYLTLVRQTLDAEVRNAQHGLSVLDSFEAERLAAGRQVGATGG